MPINNSFNLIDEPWIPVVDSSKVSLRDIFNNSGLKALGGNPIQKISLTKLLLAIAQAAHTPQNDREWSDMGTNGLADKCIAYLDKWHDRFYLYGDKPFLQIPTIAKAKIQPFGALLPEVSTGNATILTQIQSEKTLDDADKALLVVQQVGFAFSGKKVDNSIVLTPNYSGKTKSGSSGPFLGDKGFLHSFLVGNSIQETIWLNMFTNERVQAYLVYSSGVGIAPWELMPLGENDIVAQNLTKSLMGKLVPLNRFLLLAESGVHYSEGVLHLGYKEGTPDPSISIKTTKEKKEALLVDPGQLPWRSLVALRSFLNIMTPNDDSNFKCQQLVYTLPRANNNGVTKLGIWSGGLSVRSKAGEQYLSGDDNFVESLVSVDTSYLDTKWFTRLQNEMRELEKISGKLYESVDLYNKNQKIDGKAKSTKSTRVFWQLCESHFQSLVNSSHVSGAKANEEIYKLRQIFASYVSRVYSLYCPQDTARQLDAWAKAKPNLGPYLKKV